MSAWRQWTATEDRELRRLRRENLPLRRIAVVMRIDEEHVRLRAAALALPGERRTAAPDVGRVPRLVTRPAAGLMQRDALSALLTIEPLAQATLL